MNKELVLLTKEDLKGFEALKIKADEICKLAETIIVANEQNYLEGALKIKNTEQFINIIKDEEVKFLAPFNEVIARVQTITKEISDRLSVSVSIGKGKLELYKKKQIDAAKITFNNDIIMINKEKETFTNEIAQKLACMNTQVFARIFGGKYVVHATGETKESEGITNIKIAADFEEFLHSKYPPSSIFDFLSPIADQLKKDALHYTTALKSIIETGTFEAINELKEKAKASFKKTTILIEELTDKTYAKRVKELQKEYDEVKKGAITRVLKYEVINKMEVPYEYLEINDKKVKSVGTAKKKEILTGEQPIPGVKFFVQENFRLTLPENAEAKVEPVKIGK